jgi:hypothetical protein
MGIEIDSYPTWSRLPKKATDVWQQELRSPNTEMDGKQRMEN